MQKYTAYNFGHDEWDASTKALEKHLAAKDPSQRQRSPFGFGPAPGPCQPLGLPVSHADIQALRTSRPESFTTYTIRFRSSRTYLQNLLPTGFAFTSPATVVRASVQCTTLDGMTWLGGSGYNLVQLSLHGVNYTKRDGSKVFGSYAPVLFEDLADPIVTGRDDVGFPKLFANIEVREEGGAGVAIALSWRGTEFAKFQVDGLTKAEPPLTSGAAPAKPGPGPPPPPPEQGLFVYRYVPAVGEPGKADAEYPVICPFPKTEPTERLASQSASIRFTAHGWEKLPTLRHVVSKLAEMPVYGVEEATKVSGTGVDDLSGARRVDYA